VIISSRSYSGKVHRPSPLEWTDNDLRLGLILIPWVEKDKAQSVLSLGQDILKSARDEDVTRMRTLSGVIHPELAALKAAVVGMHEYIFTNFNSSELIFTAESIAFSWDQSGHFYFAKVGQPHVFVTQDSELHPLSYQPDLSSQFKLTSPLVFEGLGFSKGITVQTGEWIVGPQSSIILCCRSHIPPACMVSFAGMNELARNLAASDEERPFWIAEIKGSSLS
jgi:hypothetical protein